MQSHRHLEKVKHRGAPEEEMNVCLTLNERNHIKHYSADMTWRHERRHR